MKKIFLFALILMPIFAFANDDIERYCPKEPYPVGGNAVSLLSNITGANFISTKAIETSIQSSLKKDLNSSFNVEVYPFTIADLKSGKFKRITLNASKIEATDFYLTDFKAESLCQYNRIAIRDNNLYFAENFLLGYESKITNSNLRQTVLSPRYLNTINKIDINVSGVTLFKVYDPNIEIKDNRIHLSFKIEYSNFFKSINKTFSANASLKIQDEKIVFSDIKFGNSYGVNSNILFYILNALNPFNTKVKIDNNNTAEVKTQELEIVDNTIITKGIVVFRKNYTAE